MNHAFSRLASLVACMLAVPIAQADIQYGDGTSTSAAAGTNLPELVLVIWDRTAKVSYTRDLGVNAYASSYADGDTSKNLFVYGQQDAGYQKLFPALNADPNFQSFRAASSNVANQVWAVFGYEVVELGFVNVGTATMFTTLTNGALTPTGTNQYYQDFTGRDASGNLVPNLGDAYFNNSKLVDAAGNFAAWSGDLSSNPTTANNTHKCALRPSPCSGADADISDGSSFEAETSLGYAGKLFPGGFMAANAYGSIFNPVGSSSWFYRATTSSDAGEHALNVDEFDNLSHDAYWGLGVNAQGEYILSYTMEASLAQPQTAAGSLLRLRTDFAANYGRTRLIGVPEGDFLGGNVSPVPEPTTWGLMGLGLAVLAARARPRPAAG